ncbi:MAG TPA: bacteriohemerythrin [Rectinemataceae bacterium]|nr:bacteriohemerythrin [Rectinemataceae bacterium]
MGYIEWTNSLNIGFREIDDQHRVLVDRINSLAEAVELGLDSLSLQGILEDLSAYAAAHFSLEEGYFDRFDYREAGAHKKEHAAFVERVRLFRNDLADGKATLSAEVLEFLRSWLTNHIAFSDKKYRSTFLQGGLR